MQFDSKTIYYHNVSRGFGQKKNGDAHTRLQSMEIIFELPHLLVGRSVKVKYKFLAVSIFSGRGHPEILNSPRF